MPGIEAIEGNRSIVTGADALPLRAILKSKYWESTFGYEGFDPNVDDGVTLSEMWRRTSLGKLWAIALIKVTNTRGESHLVRCAFPPLEQYKDKKRYLKSRYGDNRNLLNAKLKLAEGPRKIASLQAEIAAMDAEYNADVAKVEAEFTRAFRETWPVPPPCLVNAVVETIDYLM